MRTTLVAAVGLALIAVPPALAAQHPGALPHWEYEGPHGPAAWGALNPAYKMCLEGKHQSPIDIEHVTHAALPAITFAYRPSPLKVIDNGHTIQVTYAPGSFITVGDKRYELQQFHFHHPAEERVLGKSYPMVAHLVHKNEAGQLAVVAVLLTEGAANRLVEGVWKYLPEQGNEASPAGVTVDANQLLPATRTYFTFEGSLTTPPCSEGVTWFVLQKPTEVSSSEVATFAHKYPHNARPLQDVNGRKVWETP